MIAVDWGTSSFRAWRLADGDGRVLDERTAPDGLLSSRGRFEDVLVRHLEGWIDADVLLGGMVGSRNGWVEVPYVEAPAGVEALAAGLASVDVPRLPGRRVRIAPGVCQRGSTPEVMRGEEVQIVGLLDALPEGDAHTVCLPGTHSKWVRVEHGRITSFRTAMTGELYALLRTHSLLAALMPAMPDSDADDGAALDAGAAAATRDPVPLASRLFGVRTRGLFGELPAAQAASYLSGLLIGDELHGWISAMAPQGEAVHLVGGSALTARYARALQALGVASRVHPETLAARGLHRLACGA